MGNFTMTDEKIESIVRYDVAIDRKDNTEFQVVSFNMPEDAFGKRMIAVLFMRIAEQLDPGLFNVETNDASGDGK